MKLTEVYNNTLKETWIPFRGHGVRQIFRFLDEHYPDFPQEDMMGVNSTEDDVLVSQITHIEVR